MSGSAPNVVMDDTLWGDAEADRRFRRQFLAWAMLFLVLGILISLVPLPPPVHVTSTSPSPRFARVLIEPAETPAPPAVPTPKAAPVPPAKPRANAQPEPRPKRKPASKPKAAPRETARAAAESAGLLALKGELSDLRNQVDAGELDRTTRRKYPTTPHQASGTSADAMLERDAARGSGGIDAGKTRAALDTTRLAGRTRSSVHSRLDSTQERVHRSGPKPGRSLEEIKLVIDRNRGAIDRLYNRALRSDPTLRGKLVLQLTIASSGRVTDCRVVSSELDAPKLERKLALRVKMMNFGPKPGPTVVLNFPIDLLPS